MVLPFLILFLCSPVAVGAPEFVSECCAHWKCGGSCLPEAEDAGVEFMVHSTQPCPELPAAPDEERVGVGVAITRSRSPRVQLVLHDASDGPAQQLGHVLITFCPSCFEESVEASEVTVAIGGVVSEATGQSQLPQDGRLRRISGVGGVATSFCPGLQQAGCAVTPRP